MAAALSGSPEKARDAQMTVLRNPYRVEMGTSGLFLSASSETEILTDKLIALGLRENRIKNRDLWDIQWLTQRDVRPSRELFERKTADRGVDSNHARHLIRARIATLEDGHTDFVREITRFLPPGELTDTIKHPEYWDYLVRTVGKRFDMV